MKNALSFDVEDYFHVTGFEHVVDRDRWDDYPVRFHAGMGKILAILDRHDVKATFFFLGWLADRYPEMVAEVAARGHEVGIHRYAHRLVYHQRPDEFAEDLERALAAVRKAYPGAILGYRAPTFSIRADTPWALEIIKGLGFRYDSSILPFRRGRHQMADARDMPYEMANGLLEFPMSTLEVLGRKLPVAGGGYLRLYPFSLTCRAIEWLNRKRGLPAIVYLHPWELDPDQPMIRGAFATPFGIGSTSPAPRDGSTSSASGSSSPPSGRSWASDRPLASQPPGAARPYASPRAVPPACRR
jgi:polysaccharide deacetylase family protein (PEP-CTERM system associated)